LLTDPGEIFKWLLPVLIVFWLISMSIFTSPALSTMELFTPADKLPRAMAVITIVANLIYSLEPVIVEIIDYIGAPLTFICGGAVVFASGLALKRNSLGLYKSTNNQEDNHKPKFMFDVKKSRHGFIFFMGAALGLGTTVMFNLFPDLYKVHLSTLLDGASPKLMLVGILVLSALISLPVSSLVNKYGMVRSLWISFVALMLSMGAMFFVSGVAVVITVTIIFSIAFTTLSVSSLPLAMSQSNYYEKVFCVGIFFSGVALPDGILSAIQAY
jgi:hypothetical protein